MTVNDEPYNERLFRGVFGVLHNARFNWAEEILRRHQPKTILEFGCFDGRLAARLFDLPELSYRGVDFGWEGGIDEATKRRWPPSFLFEKNGVLPALNAIEKRGERFDAVVALETFEHLPREELIEVVWRLPRILSNNGMVLISVPNERGAQFFAKWLVKWLLRRAPDDYRLRELVASTTGSLYACGQLDHKGFDWMTLANLMRWRMGNVRVTKLAPGLPFAYMTVGMESIFRTSATQE